ncbi:MAG TPA: hypothetical protein VE978_19720 [Chitinophagales bacterium]|nr:hypothetical protein [Chitinophagales bacterium]
MGNTDKGRKDKNPVRLRYDLKDTIHEFITNRNRYEMKEVEHDLHQEEEVELNDFAKFVNHVKSKGYKFTPSIEAVMEKFKEMQSDIKLKDKAIQELKDKTAIFGRRRQKYFEKIAKQGREKK